MDSSRKRPHPQPPSISPERTAELKEEARHRLADVARKHLRERNQDRKEKEDLEKAMAKDASNFQNENRQLLAKELRTQARFKISAANEAKAKEDLEKERQSSAAAVRRAEAAEEKVKQLNLALSNLKAEAAKEKMAREEEKEGCSKLITSHLEELATAKQKIEQLEREMEERISAQPSVSQPDTTSEGSEESRIKELTDDLAKAVAEAESLKAQLEKSNKEKESLTNKAKDAKLKASEETNLKVAAEKKAKDMEAAKTKAENAAKDREKEWEGKLAAAKASAKEEQKKASKEEKKLKKELAAAKAKTAGELEEAKAKADKSEASEKEWKKEVDSLQTELRLAREEMERVQMEAVEEVEKVKAELKAEPSSCVNCEEYKTKQKRLREQLDQKDKEIKKLEGHTKDPKAIKKEPKEEGTSEGMLSIELRLVSALAAKNSLQLAEVKTQLEQEKRKNAAAAAAQAQPSPAQSLPSPQPHPSQPVMAYQQQAAAAAAYAQHLSTAHTAQYTPHASSYLQPMAYASATQAHAAGYPLQPTQTRFIVSPGQTQPRHPGYPPQPSQQPTGYARAPPTSIHSALPRNHPQ